MKMYRCKGRGCNTQLTEDEVRHSRMFYSAFYQLCQRCHNKVGDAADKAAEEFGKKLRQQGQHSEDLIQGEMSRFKTKILGG